MEDAPIAPRHAPGSLRLSDILGLGIARVVADGRMLGCNTKLRDWTPPDRRSSLQALLPGDTAAWRAALRAVASGEMPYSSFVGNIPGTHGQRCVRCTIARDDNNDLRLVLDDITDLVNFPSGGDSSAALQACVDEFIDQIAREGDFEAAMQSLLANVGRQLGVDRSFLFVRNTQGQFDNTHEWCDKGIPSHRDSLQGTELTDFPFILQYLQNRLLFSSHVRMLPAEAEIEREALSRQGIQSVLLCPVMHQGTLCGFLGFDAVRAEREWRPAEKQILRMLGNVVGSQIALQSAGRERMEALAQLNELLETAPVVIYRTAQGPDGERNLEYASPVAETLGGYTLQQLRAPGFWRSLIHPDDLPGFDERTLTLEEAGRLALEYRVRRADGSWRWVRDDLVSVPGSGGSQARRVGYIVDVTNQREQQVMLLQASKMATLGEMSTNLAHELNQPLSTIAMSLDNLKALLAAGDALDAAAVARRIERIERQVKRAADIIDHMRIFGRRSTEPPEPFNPNEAVRGALGLVGAQFRLRGIATDFSPCDEAVRVIGEKSLLEQVLLNLLINARDAIEERRAKSRQRDLAGRVALRCDWFGAGLPLRLSVRDNGGGIPEAVIGRIFEPFYSTKPPGKGTGLGLPISYGIIRDMGGQILCTNVGEGAVFQITLPSLEADPMATGDRDHAPGM